MSRQLCGPLGALLLCATPLTASADVAQADPWFGRDKALHFGVSVGLAATGYTAGALAFPDSKAAPWVTGAAFSLSLGLGKELVDHFRQGHFSVRDLTWDALGTATGLLLSWVVDTFVVRPLLTAHRPPTHAAFVGTGR